MAVTQAVDQGGRSFAAVLVGKGQDQERDALSRGITGFFRNQSMSSKEMLERKDMHSPAGDHAVRVAMIS